MFGAMDTAVPTTSGSIASIIGAGNAFGQAVGKIWATAVLANSCIESPRLLGIGVIDKPAESLVASMMMAGFNCPKTGLF